MAKPTLEDFIDLLADAIAERLNGGGDDAPVVKKSATAQEPEPDEDEDDTEADEESEGFDEEARTAELKGMKIAELRELALELQYPEEEVKEANKSQLIQSIVLAEKEEAGVEDDDESEEEEPEEEGEDYESMTLVQLKKAAKDAGWGADDLKGLKKSDVIDLLNSEEDEEEPEEEDEEDEESEDENEWFSQEELDEMSLSELKAVAKDYDIKVPARTGQAKLRDLILNYEA